MTEAKAGAMVGKRARILDDSFDVPPGTTGTVFSALRGDGAFGDLSHGASGQSPEPTAPGWTNSMVCEDTAQTVVKIYEWNGSIEEVARAGCAEGAPAREASGGEENGGEEVSRRRTPVHERGILPEGNVGMREGFRYCEKCQKLTPSTPGRSRACYSCGLLYPSTTAPERPPTTKRAAKGTRPTKGTGVLRTKRPAGKK